MNNNNNQSSDGVPVINTKASIITTGAYHPTDNGNVQLSDSSQIIAPGKTSADKPTFGYIKTIQRRGNTYMIHDSLPSDDDNVIEMNATDKMVNDLYGETLHMSAKANKKASRFKMVYITSSSLIIILGIVIGLLTINCSWYASASGVLISAIQIFLSTFSVEKRGVLLKDISSKLRKSSRQVKTLQNTNLNQREKMRKLEELYTDVDELDLSMFDHTITTAPMLKATNILNYDPKKPAKNSKNKAKNESSDDQSVISQMQ